MFRQNVKFIFALLVICCSALWAQPNATAQSGAKFADVSLIAERDQAVAGETFFAAFKLDIEEGWHVYWRNPGDAGLPPEATWDTGGDVVGDFIWPIPEEQEVIPGELMDYGYKDQLILPFPVTVPNDTTGPLTLSGVLNYLICKDVCIPEDAAFSFEVGIGAETVVNALHGQVIGEAIALAPTPLDGTACLSGEGLEWTLSIAAAELAGEHEYLRFFPYEQVIKNAASQSSRSGASGAQLALTPGYDFETELPSQLDGIVVVEKAGARKEAYEVSAAICAPLAGTAGAGSGGLAAPVEAGGGANIFVLAWWALLGGLVLNLMPCVLPVLSMKVLGVVGAATEDGGKHLKAHGLWYTAGVLVTFAAIAGLFVGLRSAGEFLSVGFQLQNATAVAGLSLLMFVIGLWLLGMFELGSSVQGVGSELAGRKGAAGAFFTGLLAAVVGAPCIGPFLGVALGAVITEPAPVVFLVFFLVGFGLALPFLLISFVPGLHRFLPKPGAWMERLKQFFAFPMFLTALWLLSVLADLAGTEAVIGAGLGAVGIAFGIWLLASGKTVIKAVATLAILIGAFLGVENTWGNAPALAGEARASAYGAISEPVMWSEAAVQTALDQGQGVFVDFTATWCATCQLNKATTLKKPAIQAAFAEQNIVFMVADFTRRDSDIAAALQRHKRPGVPMYLFYAPGRADPVVLPQLLSEEVVMRHLDAIG